jgi:hypothetical protein
MKLVKPIKLFCSWPGDESGLDQLLVSETKPNVRTATAGVLREADAAVGEELRSLDLPDRRFDELPELAALLITDAGMQILNLDQPLAYEHHLGDFGNASNPRAAQT